MLLIPGILRVTSTHTCMRKFVHFYWSIADFIYLKAGRNEKNENISVYFGKFIFIMDISHVSSAAVQM